MLRALGIVGCLTGWLAEPSLAEQTFVTPTGEAQNVHFEQRGNGVVEITYDLVATDPRAVFAIVLEASQDAGATWAMRPQSVSGDVGSSVRPGQGKRITWDSGKDVERLVIDQFRFRIVATAGPLQVQPNTPASRTAVATTGGVSVVTTPPGAQVLVDGKDRGIAPLELRDLTPGPYRLSVNLTGYIPSSRTVEVVAGQVTRVDIPLTVVPRESQTASPAAGPAKKGGSGKWIAIGGGAAAAVGALAAGGGGGAGAVAQSSGVTTPSGSSGTVANRAPVIECLDIKYAFDNDLFATDVGVATGTTYHFGVTVSDPDGDSVTTTINYGNGISGTNPAYVYPNAGTFTPTATARDSRGAESTCSRFGQAQVVVSSIQGGYLGGPSSSTGSSCLLLNQVSSAVNGTYIPDCFRTQTGIGFGGPRDYQASGAVSANGYEGVIVVNVDISSGNRLSFRLVPSHDLKTLSGTFTYQGRTGSIDLRRQ